jgi:hypothetical protein
MDKCKLKYNHLWDTKDARSLSSYAVPPSSSPPSCRRCHTPGLGKACYCSFGVVGDMLGGCCWVLENHRSPRREHIWRRYTLSGRTEDRWEAVPIAVGPGCCYNSPQGDIRVVVVPEEVDLVEVVPNIPGEDSLGRSSEEDSSGVIGCGGFRQFLRSC